MFKLRRGLGSDVAGAGIKLRRTQSGWVTVVTSGIFHRATVSLRLQWIVAVSVRLQSHLV